MAGKAKRGLSSIRMSRSDAVGQVLLGVARRDEVARRGAGKARVAGAELHRSSIVMAGWARCVRGLSGLCVSKQGESGRGRIVRARRVMERRGQSRQERFAQAGRVVEKPGQSWQEGPGEARQGRESRNVDRTAGWAR